ncbi:hypothetical protein NAP1_02155 [Erythrobacter sp. NAP1]|uniref:hypothetical protein n=1 Tax=Erythrobacter sp. NAP1 TaxID=237727 RepID=UPI0000686F56|nr:hypothetical protein [Erythrobacter sp. NAP1]EAQ29537.1 hypothetical protein NAP1_02155 [Erythrobacter sp. NAP1]
MTTRATHFAFLALTLAFVSGCGEQVDEAPAQVLAQDPQLARALNDPLMVDPDLSWRSEANAVIAYRDGHPLPLIEAREDAAARAREEARLELLENGQIPVTPSASSQASETTFADLKTADQMVEAAGARTDCIARMDSDLVWSTRMPPTSSIMPHGMVQQAAGVDEWTCVVRVVRYMTPVSIDDALEYHWTKIERARFDITRYAQPTAQLHGERRDQKVIFEFREGPGGMTAVDVVHWRK